MQVHQRGYVQGGAYPVSGAYRIRIRPRYAWDTYLEPLFKSGYGPTEYLAYLALEQCTLNPLLVLVLIGFVFSHY
jgi:hypothetical protein